MKRILTLILAVLLCAGLLPVGTLAADDLPFVDVSPEAWYYADVKNAVDTGLVNGKTPTTYCPDDQLTYAEAVKLAACMCQKYETGTVTLVNGDPWYQSYVDYAKMKNIIAKDYDWTAPATRAGYMAIFAHALPDASLAKKNEVPDGSIPDVPMTRAEAPEIYKLYRAGILQGSDDRHSCKPDDNIKRSEVAAILTRMMFVDKRISFSMAEQKAEAPKTDTLKIVKSPQNAALKAVDDKIAFTVEISGGKAPYTYKWYIEKETGSNFQIAESEKLTSTYNVTFSKDSFTFTKYVRVYVEVTDAEGAKVTSEKAEVTPYTEAVSALKIEKQPAPYRMKTGETADPKFSVTVSGGKAPYEYKWYLDLGSFVVTDVKSSSALTGELTVTGSKDMLDLADNETVTIWCVITDAAGQSVTTDKTLLNREAVDPLKIVSQPKDVTITGLGMVTLEVTVTGGVKPYTFEWESESQGYWVTAEGYSDSTSVDGTDNSKLYLNVDSSNSWIIHEPFRCVITDARGNTVTSNVVRVNLADTTDPLKITKNLASSYTLKKGETSADFTITISGGKPPYSYYWQGSLGGGGWGDTIKTNETTCAYNTGYILDLFEHVYYVEIVCFVTDSLGNEVKSNAVWIYPYEEETDQLKITKQPQSVYATLFETVSFSIEVTGGKAPYQYDWQRSRTDPFYYDYNTWRSLNPQNYSVTSSGNGKSTLTFSTAQDDYEEMSTVFRCVVTDADGTEVVSDTFVVYYG